MRIKIVAIATDVHLNQKEVEIELEPRVISGATKTPGKTVLLSDFKVLPFEIDISDGFNPWGRW